MSELSAQEKFQQLYQQHLATGLVPNEAAARTLLELNSSKDPTILLPPPPPTAETWKSTPDRIINTNLHTTSGFTELEQLVKTALETKVYSKLQQKIFHLYSCSDQVNNTFSLTNDNQLYLNLENAKRAFALLLYNEDFPDAIHNTLRNALDTLVHQSWNICSDWNTAASVCQFLVLFQHPELMDPVNRRIVGGLCTLLYYLPEESKTILQEFWESQPDAELERIVAILQQHITIGLYSGEHRETVYAAASTMSIFFRINQERIDKLNDKDQSPARLAKLKLAFVSYSAFYNDVVNNDIRIVQEYTRSQIYQEQADEQFIAKQRLSLAELSFCEFPFLLSAASKAKLLQVDSIYRQRVEMNDAMVRNMLTERNSPYLILRVDRTNIIPDTMRLLVKYPVQDYKKPLKVKFVGEEGVDEGGVRKEFFQVVTRELLDPAFGMFQKVADTNLLWFNKDTLESTMEYELIGVLIGIAIYNSVILDLHFPSVVYKKLLGIPVNLHDLAEIEPELMKGLKDLLAFDGDVEEVYARNFQLEFQVFGVLQTVDLKPGGGSIALTNANKQEYVELYVDYLLNLSIEKQFQAFRTGFLLVCGGKVLEFFNTEELELLICGNPDFDFEALEQVTQYADGYEKDSPCIEYFWSVVHELPLQQKKRLLMFVTGSDRVPIEGLSQMQFIISKNGQDSDRLPTAHTCFNHLLLPDYSSREKLKDRLLVAIEQAEGFGLL